MAQTDTCPRCKRRMGLEWMGESDVSRRDSKTLLCDVCVDAEAMEDGVYKNDLARMLSAANATAPSGKHLPYSGPKYWED